ncbi:MAG: hypothetical protein GY803_19840 [Chloroflexi bacterium]|nr:hypothetical protein [Chloroflexota bacterium]
MENAELFGVWENMIAPPTHNMTLDAGHLAAHWRRCSLSSDFWARYAALSASPIVAPPRLPRNAVESVLSYLLNELFENTAKFSGGPTQTVRYQSWIVEDAMLFQMTNHITPEAKAPFVDLIEELLNNDPDELYFQKLEESAEFDLSGSGLGYLTLIKDYGIRFGFRFRQLNADSVAVDVQARVCMIEDEEL